MKARVQNLINQRQLSWVDTELREFEFDVGHKTEGFALDEDGLVRKLQVRQLISASLKVTRIMYESTTVYACCIGCFAVYALYCIVLHCMISHVCSRLWNFTRTRLSVSQTQDLGMKIRITRPNTILITLFYSTVGLCEPNGTNCARICQYSMSENIF